MTSMGMRVPATMIVKRVLSFACPHCATGEHSVTHLQGGITCSFGPWQCDECGWLVSGIWHGHNDTVTISNMKERPKPVHGYMLLRLAPSKTGTPVYIVVKDKISTRDSGPDFSIENEIENKRFWVEDHTCPTNIVDVAAIIETSPDYDGDPHGVLQFVAWVPAPEDWDEANDDWRKLFPMLSREIDGVVVPETDAIPEPEAGQIWISEDGASLRSVRDIHKASGGDPPYVSYSTPNVWLDMASVLAWKEWVASTRARLSPKAHLKPTFFPPGSPPVVWTFTSGATRNEP